MDQSYIGRWIVRLDGYHMIIEHRMREKHQNADSLSKKTEFYERLDQKQASQAEIKEGFSFLDKETYEALPLTRWLDKSGHPIPGHPELPVEKAAEIKILSKRDPVPLDLLLRSNLVQQELSRMNINILSLLEKTMQVTPQVMRMLGGLLEREVTRDDPEWAAAMASLIVREKVRIKPSIRQHKDNERDCRSIVQQLVSSIPQEVLVSTSYGRKMQDNDTREKTVTFKDQDGEGEKVLREQEQEYLSGETNGEKSRRVRDQNPGQGNMSGESEMNEEVQDKKQDLGSRILSGEFRWMRRRYGPDLKEGVDSIIDASMEDSSRNSSMDTYSDRNSSSRSELSELAIHTLLVETHARDLDREVYQDPDSDRCLIPDERIFDNAADDLETIAASKRSIGLLPQKEVVERQNRTLVSMLRVYCSRYMTDWDRYLPQVMGAYNSTQHSTTGVIPHMMLTGHEKSLPLTFFYPEYEGKKTSPQVYVRDVIRRQQELNDLCRRNTQQAQARQRKRFDKKAAGAKAYSVGDYV